MKHGSISVPLGGPIVWETHLGQANDGMTMSLTMKPYR